MIQSHSHFIVLVSFKVYNKILFKFTLGEVGDVSNDMDSAICSIGLFRSCILIILIVLERVIDIEVLLFLLYKLSEVLAIFIVFVAGFDDWIIYHYFSCIPEHSNKEPMIIILVHHKSHPLVSGEYWSLRKSIVFRSIKQASLWRSKYGTIWSIRTIVSPRFSQIINIIVYNWIMKPPCFPKTWERFLIKHYFVLRSNITNIDRSLLYFNFVLFEKFCVNTLENREFLMNRNFNKLCSSIIEIRYFLIVHISFKGLKSSWMIDLDFFNGLFELLKDTLDFLL